jgi:hypothetical protein
LHSRRHGGHGSFAIFGSKGMEREKGGTMIQGPNGLESSIQQYSIQTAQGCGHRLNDACQVVWRLLHVSVDDADV